MDSLNTQRFVRLLFTFSLIGVAAIYFFLSYKTSLYAGITADGAIYLQLADIFSPYYPFGEGRYEFIINNYPFPPLYPIVLGYVGGGSGSPLISYMLSAVVMLLVLSVMYVWCRQLGISRGVSLMLMLCFSFMPVTLQHLLVIESEHLYLLLTLSGVVALNRSVAGVVSYSLPGVLFGLSALTRTIGVVAIISYVLVTWRYNRMGRAVTLLAASAFPLALWVVYKAIYFSQEGYLPSLYEAFQGDVVSNVLTQISVNSRLLWLYWVGCFDFHRAAYVSFFLWPVSLLVVSGLLVRLKNLEADAIYVAGYVFVIIVWPYPAQMERFLFAILPFLLVYGVLSIRYTYGLFHKYLMGKESPYLYGYVALIILLIGPSLVSAWSNISHPLALKYTDLARTSSWLVAADVNRVKLNHEFMLRIYKSMEEVSELVPAGECIISTEPAYLMLYSGRNSIKPKPKGVGDRKFFEGIRQCKYIFMMAAQSHPSVGNPPMYPFHRVKNNMQVLSVRYISDDYADKRVSSMLVKYPADAHQ